MSASAIPWGQLRAHALDIILSTVLLWELIRGYRAGLVLTAAGIAGRILAAVVGWAEAPALVRVPWVARWVPPVARWLHGLAAARHLALSLPQAAAVTVDVFRVAAFLLIYWAVYRLLIAVAAAVSRAIHRVPVLGDANRVGGAALGLAISAVELGLLAAFVLTIAADMHAAGTVRWIDRSWLVTHLDGPGERIVQDALRRWNAQGAAALGAGSLRGLIPQAGPVL